MTSRFSVRVTSQFERQLRKLLRRHAELEDLYGRAVEILEADPANRSRAHDIRKLEGVAEGEGAWRLRLRRFRFRYDLLEEVVVLHHVGLRREDTYRG